MKAQIPCGLNFCMSGIPYWTMDIGGFAVESRYYKPSAENLEEWRELMTRWFQFGTFVPIFRSHGEFPYREIYNTAPENHPAYQAIVATDRLRYRLMPYIYSLAGQTYLNDYTIMRGLAMDFLVIAAMIRHQYVRIGTDDRPVTEYKPAAAFICPDRMAVRPADRRAFQRRKGDRCRCSLQFYSRIRQGRGNNPGRS
jgi:hypothetical protein